MNCVNGQGYKNIVIMPKVTPASLMHIISHKYYYIAPDPASRAEICKYYLQTRAGPTVEKPVNIGRKPKFITART